MVKYAVLSNPQAKGNKPQWFGRSRLAQFDALAADLQGRGISLEHRIVETVDSYPNVTDELISSGVGYVFVNGGDGTLDRVMTTLANQYGSDMPAIMPLAGGTFNLGATVLGGYPTSPIGAVRNFVENVEPENAPHHVRNQKVLRIATKGHTQYALFFGAGIVARFYQMYENNKEVDPPGAIKALRLLAEVGMNLLFSYGNERAAAYIAEKSAPLDAVVLSASLGDDASAQYLGLVSSAIDTKVNLRVVCFNAFFGIDPENDDMQTLVAPASSSLGEVLTYTGSTAFPSFPFPNTQIIHPYDSRLTVIPRSEIPYLTSGDLFSTNQPITVETTTLPFFAY